MTNTFLLYVRRYSILLLTCSSSMQLLAQNDNSTESAEFDDFRKELQDEYTDFRKEINREYVGFLSKAWKEYRLFQGKSPDEVPKPLSPVRFQEEKNGQEVLVRPEKVVEGYFAKEPVVEEVIGKRQPKKEERGQKGIFIDYFGAELYVNYQSRPFQLAAIDERSVGNLWKGVADSRFSVLLVDMLRYKKEMRMNDWAYFLLAEKIASCLSVLQSEDCRTVFQHFLLVQSGYDVRLARVDRSLVLLIPVRDEVYARPYLMVDGKQYYVISKKDLKSYSSIYTYQLAEKLIKKPYLSLKIHQELLLPMQPKVFCIKIPGLEIKGEVNANKIRFYREYLSCELSVYACAAVDARLSKQLIASFAAQLDKKPPIAVLNLLLSWVQNGFRYQTDGEQFGYEKPFFLEENFYYPASDCEDRSILFAFLVRNLLKKKVVLLDYPGHVATAVCMDEEIKGAYVLLDGKKYVVCDPTYVNAEVGRVMPDYREKRPKVIKLEL